MSRRLLKGTFALTCCLILLAWTTPALAQRPSGGGPGDPAQAAPLDAAHVLENFAEIVEIIWSDEEASAWERLQTDEERQAFIVSFWETRDPSPETPDNEFRDLYMARVQDAYSRFSRGDNAGYADPRGQVFIMYGGAITLQDNRQVGAVTQTRDLGDPTRETDPRPTDGAAARTQRLVWEMDVSKNPYLEGKEEIQFIQGRGGFSLNTRGLEFSQEAFLANTDVQAYFAGDTTAGGATGRRAGAAPMPPDFVAMRELLDNGTLRSELAVAAELNFFPAPENTYTVVQRSGLPEDLRSAVRGWRQRRGTEAAPDTRRLRGRPRGGRCRYDGDALDGHDPGPRSVPPCLGNHGQRLRTDDDDEPRVRGA